MVYVYLNHTTRCLPGLRARVAEVKIEYAIGENVSISHSDWILKKSEGRKERINHRSLWIHQRPSLRGRRRNLIPLLPFIIGSLAITRTMHTGPERWPFADSDDHAEGRGGGSRDAAEAR
mmetsp:Transcript_61603/g.165523  ORF Transcript_61603/g.165523 Transcript_61603/m.165523 type:complete len:120 (+) Transcript_61603:606-965(+)